MATLKTDDPLERSLIDWIEASIGGTVTSITRQNRWRPAWFVDLETATGIQPLYVRGDRSSKSIVFPLEHEYRVLKVLEANGLPVPHVFGLCPDPLAIVMTRMPGRPDLSTAANDEERQSVLDHYVELLVAMHAIDPAEFEAVGLERPIGPEQLALNQFERQVALYRETKRRPEPLLEFMIGWVRRNVPHHRSKVSLICSDAWQFLFENGRVTAMLDFELAHLGDAMQDLAVFQMRDTSEPLGDAASTLRRYAALAGEPLDGEAFDFHAIEFALATPLSMADSVSRLLPTGSVLQYMEWSVHLSRVPLEWIAAREGVRLEPLPPLSAQASRYGPLAESLVGAIRAIPASDSFAVFERESAAQLAEYLRRIGEFGPEIERQDIAEVEALLGETFDSWQAADGALERFVLSVGAEQDATLIPLFHRRIQRQQLLLAPLLSRPSVAKRLKSFDELIGSSAL